MLRNASNTLILTSKDDKILDSDLINDLVVREGLTVEVIILYKLGRILLVCEGQEEAKILFEVLKDTLVDTKINYSFMDTQVNGTNEYLQLPDGSVSRRFLISPPPSPPPEWNHWERIEERPSEKAIHGPEEMSNLLWERLGGFQSTTLRKYQQSLGSENQDNNSFKIYDWKDEPQILFENINKDAPAIILDTVSGQEHDVEAFSLREKSDLPKTSLPPLK